MRTRRREERVAISLPLRVWGMDANHKPFTQTATTLDVTRMGVRIGGLSCLLEAGEIVGVQYGDQKARFRIVWVGRKGGSQTGQAGLTCVEPGKYIWGASLEQLAKLAAPRTPAASSVTVTTPAPTAPPSASPEPERSVERRRESRLDCNGSAQLADLASGAKIWGTVCELSPGGCYIETTAPPRQGSVWQLTLALIGTELHCKAEVRTCSPGMGVGVTFLEMSDEDRHRLDMILERLEGKIDIPIALPARCEKDEPAAPHPKAAELAAGTHKILNDVRSVQTVIESSRLQLDPRVMDEVRRTINQARQNLWSIQQWLQGGAQEKDAYRLLHDVELARTRAATDLMRDLSMDIDANTLHLGSEGMAELIAAINLLHRRAVKLTQATHPALNDPSEPAQT